MTEDSHSESSEIPIRINKKNLSETEEAALGMIVSSFAACRENVYRIHNFDPVTWQVEDEPLKRVADAVIEGSIHPLLKALSATHDPKSAMQATMSGVVVTAFLAGREYEKVNPTERNSS